jgi:hypothetical protein
MPGAELLGLQLPAQVVGPAGGPDRVPAMAENHCNISSLQCTGCWAELMV